MVFNIYNRISVFFIISGTCILLAYEGSVYGYTGKEITLNLGNAEFVPQNETADYQISINVNYSVSDPTLVGKVINAVMKVHSSDGSVIKTTSFPLGFTANNTGIAELLLTYRNQQHRILQLKLCSLISTRRIYYQILFRLLLILTIS